MKDLFLYNSAIIPIEFIFPNEYIDFIKNNSDIDLEPWSLLCNDKASSLSYYGSML